MVAVGDSNQVFLYDISPSGYNRIATLTGKNKVRERERNNVPVK